MNHYKQTLMLHETEVIVFFKKALQNKTEMTIYPHYFDLSISVTQFPLSLFWQRILSKTVIVRD